MADELPEVGAFNQQPTLADVGKSSAATSLGSIGSLINLASKNLDPNAEQMFRELSGSDSVETDLPDVAYFKEMFGAPETLNIGDFVSIDPFSKVLAGGKGIMAMLPYITASGLNVTKRLETIGQIRNRAESIRKAARSSENPKLKEAEYKEADKLDLEAKRLEDSLSPEDVIGNKQHIAAQSTKEGKEKGRALFQRTKKKLELDQKVNAGLITKEEAKINLASFVADQKNKLKRANEIKRNNLKLAKKSGYDVDEAEELVDYYKGEELVDDGYGTLQPERDFPDLSLSSSSDQITQRMLKNHGFSEVDSVPSPYPNSIFNPNYTPGNVFINQGNNKYTVYEYKPGISEGSRGKYTQKTFNAPTLKSLRDFLGYAKGGSVDKSLYTYKDFTKDLLDIDPKKKNYSKGDEVSGVGQPNFLADTLSNVPSSAYQLGSDVAQFVTSPVQTLDAIGNLGLGLIALAIPDAYQEEKLDKPQEAAMAVGQYAVDRLGSIEAVKETIRTDPVGFIADISGILLGGGYLATKAGLKAGQVATKAGIAIDPLVIAGKGVSEVGKGITRRDVLKGAGAGVASLAVPMSMMTDVTKAIPPVAKSTGILAGIGKFKGIMNNLEPYLLGSKSRDQMNPGKYGSNKRAEAIDKLYPEIGYSDSIGNYDLKTINTKQMSKFQKTHNLESKDFSVIDDFKMFDPVMKKTSSASENTLNSLNDAGDIFKKLDDAPDKTVTVKKINRTPTKEELLVHPDWGRRESKLTTGTVDGVPIMKNQVFQEINDRMINMGLTFYMPNKAGLEKLAKAKPNLAKGGFVDKALYTDQKYI